MEKMAKELVAGDRIHFNSLDLMTNDGHPCPLVAEVLRITPVWPGNCLCIFTTSGALFPVGREKGFEVVEGDYDGASQMTYAPEVGPAEVFQGRSIE